MIGISFYMSVIETEEDRDKLEQIYEKYKKLMTAVAYSKVGKYSAEEDVVHDAILKIINYLDRLDPDDPKTGIFIRVVTKSCALDWLKHKFTKKYNEISYEDIPVDMADEEIPPAEQIISEDGYTMIVDCIKNISPTYKDACELRFIFNMNEKEISDILNITPKNVGIRIFRGRKELAEKLKEAGYNVEYYKR